MMVLHVLATFVVVCFIALEWGETLSIVFDWIDMVRSSIFTMAVGYLLFLSWIK